MLHTGPANLAHAIRVPTCPELIILFAILFDSMMATPAAGSRFLPFSPISEGALCTHVFPWNLFCA